MYDYDENTVVRNESDTERGTRSPKEVHYVMYVLNRASYLARMVPKVRDGPEEVGRQPSLPPLNRLFEVSMPRIYM